MGMVRHLFFYTEMRFRMIKLVASDLDDTLLNKDSRLSAENKQAIAEALRKGLIFTISTGRMFQSTLPFARELGLPEDQPIICYNGALIRRLSGETLYEQPLSPDVSSLVVDHGQSRGWTINAYFDDELYVAKLNQEVRDYATRVRCDVTEVGDLVQFIQDGGKRLSKLMVISEPSQTPERMEELRPLVGDDVQLVRSRPRFIEITNRQAHKGAALCWLAQALGVKPDEVMAVGDSQNDLTMLEAAGVGVAVANASLEIQAVADHVVATHYDHGVAQAIHEFALQSR